MRDVEITLDKTRTLRFTIQALRDLQHVSGQPLSAFVHTLSEVSVDHLLWTIWAGLKYDRPKLTIEQVVPLLEKYVEDGGSLNVLMRQVNDGLISSGLFKEPVDLSLDPLGEATPAAPAEPLP